MRAWRRWCAAALVLAAAAWAADWAAYRAYPFPYRQVLGASAGETGVPPLLVLAVMRTESRFRPGAVSDRGAVGLLQLTPATAAWVATQRWPDGPFRESDLLDPGYNIGAGSWYLGYLLRLYGGHVPAAIAAYNAGPARVSQWLGGGVWDGTAARSLEIPYPETRLFVQRVLATYAVYRLLYPHQAGTDRSTTGT